MLKKYWKLIDFFRKNQYIHQFLGEKCSSIAYFYVGYKISEFGQFQSTTKKNNLSMKS